MTEKEEMNQRGSENIKLIPIANTINDAKIAVTGTDLNGTIATPGERINAGQSAALDIGTLGIGSLEGTVAKTAGLGAKAGTELLEGVGKSVDISKLAPMLKTETNTAFFWSGKTNGIGGAEKAAEIAKTQGGTTLESMIADKNIKMPEWNSNDPGSVKAWEDISAEYARQASGEVKAVVGKELRADNIWENVELPRLKQNPNVTKITTIDPESGIEKVIFERK